MVVIRSVEEGSVAAKAGVRAGDVLVKIDSHPIRDVLDYRFYLTEARLTLTLLREGRELTVSLRKGRYDDPGLEFDTYLMDEKQRCRNGCIFCFIDQNPKGMRSTVYFKDDDTRLSFLMGNYVTLTNVDGEELERICKMKLSPVNVSVHTTDPALRCEMLKNRFAGDVMAKLRFLAEGGVKLNCQLVLCRGINDGAALERTLEDLLTLYPAVESVAAVPAGLTGHREGLYPLTPYDKESAEAVLRLTDAFGEKTKKALGTRFVFCSDEFYLLSGRELPQGEFYEGYPQLDNGVGSLALMEEELSFALEDVEQGSGTSEDVTLITGEAAYRFMKRAVERIRDASGATGCWRVLCAKNLFFGGSVTVAGLLTGSDILAAAKEQALGQRVLLPAQMLRSGGDLFLDDMTPRELEERLGVKVEFTSDAAELVEALTHRKDG